MKAQADFTRATLDRIPGRATLLKRIAELGDAVPARVSGVQVNNGHYYYLKRLANENIPKLYVRAGLSRQGAPPRRSGGDQGRARPAFRHRLLRAFAGQPVRRVRHVAGGSEESVLHVVEVATGKETGEAIDRAQFGPPSWTEDNLLLYNRLAEARARCAEGRQVSEEPRLPPCRGQRPRARSRDPRSGRHPRHRVGPVGDSDRGDGPRRRVRDRNRRQRQPARVRHLRRTRGIAAARRSAVDARRRPRRRSDRCSIDRQHAVSAHAQERAAFQGAARRSRQSRPRVGAGRRAGERRRDHRHRRGQGRALRAPDVGGRERPPPPRARIGRERHSGQAAVRGRHRCARRRSAATGCRVQHRDLDALRRLLRLRSGRGSATSTRSCSRRVDTTTRATSSRRK